MEFADKKVQEWLATCKANNWPSSIIATFFYEGLYDEDVTYVFCGHTLMCKPVSEIQAAQYAAWNRKYPEYNVNILRLY